MPHYSSNVPIIAYSVILPHRRGSTCPLATHIKRDNPVLGIVRKIGFRDALDLPKVDADTAYWLQFSIMGSGCTRRTYPPILVDYGPAAFGLADGISGRLFMRLPRTARRPNPGHRSAWPSLPLADIFFEPDL